VAGNAAVTVQPPSGTNTLTDVLHVQSGAKVNVGFAPVGNAVEAGAHLTVNTFANVRFDDGAILAVAAAPGTVTLADKDSGIALLPGSRLAVVAGAGAGATSTDPIGSTTGSSVIVVPSNGSSASISIDTVYKDVGATEEDNTLKTALETAKETINATSTTPTVSDGSKVQDAFDDSATKVTYTGTDALGEVTIPEGATLIITGEITGQTDEIEVEEDATLEITDGASIDFGATGTISGTGTVINNGTIKTAATTITALNAILKAKGKITATATITAVSEDTLTVLADTKLEITGLTVSSGTKLTVAAVPATSSITATTITNTSGTIAVADAATLALVLSKVNAGTVEVSADLEIGTATVTSTAVLKIATGKTLTVTGTLTVDAARVTGDTGATIDIQGSGQLTAPSNFYDTDGEGILIPITAGTYTWNTDVDGSGAAGWKAGFSTSKTATTPAQVTTYLAEGATKTVTYTATGAPLAGDTSFEVPDGKTLIITGTINDQAQKIEGGGTVENNGTINTATTAIDYGILSNLAGLEGSGKVVLKAEVGSVTAPLVLGTDLDIGVGGSIAFADAAQPAFSGTSKTVTLVEDTGGGGQPRRTYPPSPHYWLRRYHNNCEQRHYHNGDYEH
jgi:hypothetical protein